MLGKQATMFFPGCLLESHPACPLKRSQPPRPLERAVLMGFKLRATGEALSAPPAVLPCVDLPLHSDDYLLHVDCTTPEQQALRAQGRAATTYGVK